LFAGSHLLTAPKPAIKCYVIERFIGTIAQRCDFMHEGSMSQEQEKICINQSGLETK